MARAGFWMRGARGTVADATFRKGKGKTIMSEKATPKNPQTALQMAQRIIWATVAQARANMRAIVDHSFENKQGIAENLNEFTRLNIARLRAGAAIDFEQGNSPEESHVYMTTKGVSALVANPFVMSKGSLEYEGALNFDVDANGLVTFANSHHNIAVPTNTRTVNNATQYYTTYKDLAQAFLGCGKNSSQFTMCIIYNNTGKYVYSYLNDTAPGFQIPTTRFKYGRLVVKESADLNTEVIVDAAAPMGSADVAQLFANIFDKEKSDQELWAVLLEQCDLYVDTTTTPSAPYIKLECEAELDDFESHVLAGCVIYSELDGQKWRRSTSYMVCGTPGESADGDNNGLTWNVAIDAWFAKDKLQEETRFLDHGGDNDGNF